MSQNVAEFVWQRLSEWRLRGFMAIDDLGDARVTVVPMQAPKETPHLELLSYHVPLGKAELALQANDVAATRIVWQGTRADLLRDPDGHLQQIAMSGQEPPR